MFLKDKGAQINELINEAITNQHREKRGIFETFESTSKILSQSFETSLNQTIESVRKIASYLNSTEIPDKNLGEKVLHKTIENVGSDLESFSSGYKEETANDVFSNILNIFPQVGSNLQSLDWTGLTTFQPVSDIAKVIQLSNDLKKSNLARNVMKIMNYVQTSNPEFKSQVKFVSEKVELFAEEQHLKDLAGGMACMNLLMQLDELSNKISSFNFFSFDFVQPLEILNEAYKCESFVSEHRDDLENVLEISTKLSDVFNEAITAVESVSSLVEEHLGNIEKPVFTTEHFADVLQALEKVKEMTTGWSLLGNKKEEQVNMISQLWKSKSESNVDGSVGFLNHTSVIPSAEIAQSFINLYESAVIDPIKNLFVLN